MFNIGGGELLVIALIALIVLGPQRLPGAARQVGKTVGELRRISTGFQNELRHAFDEAERTESAKATDAAVGAVSAQSAPATSPHPWEQPPAAPAPGRKTSTPKKAAAKKASAKRAPAKKAATKKPTAKKAAAKKKAAPARRSPSPRSTR
jgi:sec-independent protein translocase protein TatB